MSTIHFSAAPLGAEGIDDANGIIRGVSVITSGIVARGHDLSVDGVTLQQMQRCAVAKGQVPVKVDHKSGAAAVCGFLTNFRQSGNKLKADWHLLESHPQKDQILEVARRMPGGVGLSAAFVTPDDCEPGFARCQELVSVDYVTLPAANPDGLFSARPTDIAPAKKRPLSRLEKVRRAIGAAAQGVEVGAVGGLAAGAVLRRPGLTSDGASAAGALVGGIASGAHQWYKDSKRDSQRDLAALVAQRCFEDRATLHRLTNAASRNIEVPIPGADAVDAVRTVAKNPLARRVAVKALKIGIGSGLGYVAGKKIGAKSGALAGAVAGALFSSPEVRSTVRLAILKANHVTDL